MKTAYEDCHVEERSPTRSRAFLTAEWRSLAVLNYEIDREALLPYLPRGTELDLWNEQAMVSLVGFKFLNTRIWGVSIPLHRDFVEVNLRFYVRRRVGNTWRRGVVFIRELAPRPAVTWIASLLYGENYLTVPMRHRLTSTHDSRDRRRAALYAWRHGNRAGSVAIATAGHGAFAPPGSLEEFIIEHYWGYSGGPRRPTIEYRVEHPRWRLWPAKCARFRGGANRLYGEAFAQTLASKPVNAFYVDGSPVTVYRGQRIA